MTIPEGATHVDGSGKYYRFIGDGWYFRDSNKWWLTNTTYERNRDNLKELYTATTWKMVEFDASKQLSDRTPNRDEALQWLVDNVKDWSTKTEGCNYPSGWSWELHDGGNMWRVVLAHTSHDPITQYDWNIACQVSRMRKTRFHGDTPPSLESFGQPETPQEMAERFNRDVLCSTRKIHPNVIKFAQWIVKELNRDER